MNCMRCGRKTEGRDVFCPDCLGNMEKYPVTPGAVYIPVRPAGVPQVRTQKGPSLEEQLARAQARIRNLRRWVAGLLAALVLSGAGLALLWNWGNSQVQPTPGKNYTTSTGS